MKTSEWELISPQGLRKVADMLDVLDRTLRALIPYAPGTPEERAEAFEVVNSDEMQTSIRIWADNMELGLRGRIDQS